MLTTCLNPSEIDMPLPSTDVGRMRDILKKFTTEDIQCVHRLDPLPKKFFRKQKYRDVYEIYLYCGGVLPYIAMGSFDENGVLGYYSGILDGLDLASTKQKAVISAPVIFGDGFLEQEAAEMDSLQINIAELDL